MRVKHDGIAEYCPSYVLSAENVIFVDFFALKFNGSDINSRNCLASPVCVDIQTSHGFDNFCFPYNTDFLH